MSSPSSGSQRVAGCRLVLSDPGKGAAQGFVLTPEQLQTFIGKRIGSVLDGSVVGIKKKIKVTGGTDAHGFPLRPDVHGGRKTKILASGGVGYHPKRKPPSKRKKRRNKRPVGGKRKRILVRGNVVPENVAQINAIILQASQTP